MGAKFLVDIVRKVYEKKDYHNCLYCTVKPITESVRLLCVVATLPSVLSVWSASLLQLDIPSKFQNILN